MFEAVSCLLHTPLQNASRPRGTRRGRGGDAAEMPGCTPHPLSGPSLAPGGGRGAGAVRHAGRCRSRGIKHHRHPPTSPRHAAPRAPAWLGQDKSSGEPCQHRPGPVLEGFSFTESLCFYQNGFSAVIASFFFSFFFSQGKHHFQLHFSGFPLKNEKQMLLHAGKTWKNV